MQRAYYFLVFVLFVADAYSLIVISETYGNVSFNTPNHFYMTDFVVQAPLKLVNPAADCDLKDFEPLSGYIIINTEFSHRLCNLGTWRDRGVVAIILIGSEYDVPAGYRYIWAFLDPPQLPFGEISRADISRLQELLAVESNVTAIFQSGDPNEWREYAQSTEHTALLICIIIISFGAAVVSAFVLFQRIQLVGPLIALDKLSLGLVTVSSLDVSAAMIYYLVRHLTDQIGFFEVFIVFLILSDGLQLVACLAISFYWHHLMNDLNKTHKRIPKKIAVPLFIFGAVIALMLIVLIIAIPVPAADSTTKIVAPISYIIIAMVITIGWLVFGSKLYKYLKKSSELSEGKKNFVKELSTKIIVASIMLFVTRILEIVWTICILVFSPQSILISMVFAALVLVATNVMIAMFFKRPNRSQRTPSKESGAASVPLANKS